MRSFRSVLSRLGVMGAMLALAAVGVHATPTVTAECYAVQMPDGSQGGTERTWFIFRAQVTLGGDPPNWQLANTGTYPVLKIGVMNTGDAVTSPYRTGIKMVRDSSRGSFSGKDSFWIAMVRGSQINPRIGADGTGYALADANLPGGGAWAVVASDVDTTGNPPVPQFGASAVAQVNVYPSFANQAGQPALTIVPVDANGSNDKAAGPGQNGNGLRVDPQEPTRPNDGGGAHRFNWRVRVSTLSGMPPTQWAKSSTFDNWTLKKAGPTQQAALSSGVILYLIDPGGNIHRCPMQADGFTAAQLYPTTGLSGGTVITPQGNAAFTSGVIYSYRVEPTEFSPAAFGGDLQDPSPLFTMPDGTATQVVGGYMAPGSVLNRPYANVYAAFGELDTTLLYAPFSPPPAMPDYTITAGRAGQWHYYYRSSLDFRSTTPVAGTDPKPWNSIDNNFLVTGWGDAGTTVVSKYQDQYGNKEDNYTCFEDGDEPYAKNDPLSLPPAYGHPYVTPIISDGMWTDDLKSNAYLQLPPGDPAASYSGDTAVPYDDTDSGKASNTRRSRLTTKTAVRFQCKITHVPQPGISGPLNVHVWIGDYVTSGSMQSHIMQVAPNQGTLDYEKGVLYYYDTVYATPPPAGWKGFFFEADDGVNRCIWPRRPDDDVQGGGLAARTESVLFWTVNQVGKNYQMGPRVNNRPVLSGGSVSPTTGPAGTNYTYEVTYRDADNDPPLDAWVIIDRDYKNKRLRLTEAPEDQGKSYAEGRRFRITTNVVGAEAGSHNFFFQFRDNWAQSGAPIRREWGEWTTYPAGDDNGNEADVLPGPTPSTNGAPTLRMPEFKADDTAMNAATKWDFFVTYSDPDDTAPTTMQVLVDKFAQQADGSYTLQANAVTATMVPVTAPAPGEYKTGVRYHLANGVRVPGLAAGEQYRYRFNTSDGVNPVAVTTIGTGATSDTDGSWHTLNFEKVVGGWGQWFDPAPLPAPTIGTFSWVPDATLYVWVNGSLVARDKVSTDIATGEVRVQGTTGAETVRAAYNYTYTLGPKVVADNSPQLLFANDRDSANNYQTVSPITGDTTATFNFNIIYKDADNQMPRLTDDVHDGLYLVVDGTNRIALSRNPAPPATADFTAGVTYAGSLGSLSAGVHSYHFEATDGSIAVRRPLASGDVDGNGNPIAAELKLNIFALQSTELVEAGYSYSDAASNEATLFDFFVRYRSPNNVPPAGNQMTVYLSKDGGATYDAGHTMVPAESGTDYKSGVQYHLGTRMTLTPGQYLYKFRANDGTADVLVVHVGMGQFSVTADKAKTLVPVGASNTVYHDAVGTFKWRAAGLYIWKGAGATATLLTAGTDYVLDAAAGTITLAAPNTTGDPIRASYYYEETTGPNVAAGSTPTLTPPSNDPADAPNFKTVDPLRGDPNTTFSFSIIYTSPTNQPPVDDAGGEGLYAVVDGGTAGAVRLHLARTVTGTVDYRTGITYTGSTKLVIGNHFYHFEATDRPLVAPTRPIVRYPAATANPAELPLPVVESEGQLIYPSAPDTVIASAGLLTIDTTTFKGKSDAVYRFTIVYKNADDRAPLAPVELRVGSTDGQTTTKIQMSAIDAIQPGSYKAGVRYRADITAPNSPLEAGSHQVSFGLKDRTTPTAGPLTLIVNDRPVLTGATETPNPASQSETLTFSVKYTDPILGDQGTVNLLIDGTATAVVPTTTPPTPTKADRQAGVVYTWSIAGSTLTVGDHTMQFTAADDTESALSVPTPPSTFTVTGKGIITLTEPSVVPDPGSSTATFVYSVKYANTVGAKPLTVDVLIDEGTAAEKRVAMAPKAGQGTDYKAGVVFVTAPQSLASGSHTYRFEASDPASNVTLPDTGTAAFVGPKVNFAPTLTAVEVQVQDGTQVSTIGANNVLTPAVVGNLKQGYTFRVTYGDKDNVAPAADGYVRVYISGVTDPLVLAVKSGDAGNYGAGVVYEGTVTGLKPGDHTFHIEAFDGNGTAGDKVRLPDTGEVSGLSVKNVPQLLELAPGQASTNNGTLDLLTGTTDDTYTFTVNYRHLDGTAPSKIQLVLDPGTANEKKVDVTPKSSAPYDYVAGVVYQYAAAPGTLAAGIHTYRFEATDGVTAVTLKVDGTAYTGPTIGYGPKLSNIEVLVAGSATVSTPNASNVLQPLVVGNVNQSFVFRLTYTDKDNVAPNAGGYVRVLISGKSAPVDMAVKAGDAGNYAAGVVYEATVSGIKAGAQTFHFIAADGTGPARYAVRLPAAAEVTGLTVTNVPVLSEPSAGQVTTNGGTLDKLTGIVNQAYTYSVNYRHADGTAPSTINMTLDAGTAAEKTVALVATGGTPDYTAGVLYQYTSAAGALPVGTHTYRFNATDGVTPVTLKTDGTSYTGPTITNAQSVLSAPTAGTLSPLVGPPSVQFTYQVVYKNADVNPPSYVKVVIDGVEKTMTRATTSTKYDEGVTYEYVYRFARDEKTRKHTYSFKANDTLNAGEATFPTPKADIEGPTLNVAQFLTPTFAPIPTVVGGKVTVTGVLDTNSPIGALPVSVQWIRPDGTGVSENLTTAADGSYGYTSLTQLDQTGDWQVKLGWNGVTGTYDAVSAVFPFKVTGVTMSLQAATTDLIALPIIPVTPDPSITFGTTNPSDGSSVPVTALDLVVWSAVGNRYLSLNRDTTFPGAAAGAGYWVRPTQAVAINPRGKLWKQTDSYSIAVPAGWSIIGTVYTTAIPWSSVKVRFQGSLLDLASASAVVRPYAWGYDPGKGGYTMVQAGGALASGRGYWVKALQACELVLPGSGAVAPVTVQHVGDLRDGAIQVVARMGNILDTDNFMPMTGITQAYADTTEKPPYPGDFVGVKLVATDSVKSLVTGAGQTVLPFEVSASAANTDITVQFPTLATLGRRFEATVVDLTTNARKMVSASGAYTFNTGDNQGARKLALILSPVTANSRLVITELRSAGRAAGALSFSYALSGTATVQATVVGINGKSVRSLVQGRAAAQGTNSLIWDGKDNRGTAVPSGAYLVKLTATDSTGHTAQAVLPITLVR